MVNRYDEIAEKMPWIKKKDNPKKPWDSSAKSESTDKPSSGIMASKDDVITKIKNIQGRVNVLTQEKEALTFDLSKANEEINARDNIIKEKENANNDLKEQIDNIEKEKENAVNDLQTQIDNVVKEKEEAENEFKAKLDTTEKEKETWQAKVNDLEKALKTSTSEKLYLEQELAAADKALNEINNLLAS